MRRWLWPLFALLAAAAVIALTIETRRLAEQVGRGEIEARERVRQHDEVARDRDAARAAEAASTAEVRRLEGELFASQQRLEGIQEVVRERTEQLEQAAIASQRRSAELLEPMPEGVRLCLQALHQYLRSEGFTQQRFLSAKRLDGDGLHDVEMIETAADGLSAAFFQAGRCSAMLDRASGRLELRFFDGIRTEHGEAVALPEDGWVVAFAPIDGHVVETRLPMLVHAEGSYPPVVDPAAAAREHDVDGGTRRQWLRRFERLLESSGTAEHLTVQRFRGMADGCFLTAEIHGTDDKHLLLMYANCERLAVEVDDAAGVVSLLLRGGVLHREGVESTITDRGLRMLLPNVTPQMATETMLGMVVAK